MTCFIYECERWALVLRCYLVSCARSKLGTPRAVGGAAAGGEYGGSVHDANVLNG